MTTQEPSEPSERTEPSSEPSEPPAESESTEPSESTDRLAESESTEPSESTERLAESEPIEPSESTERLAQSEPTEPSESTERLAQSEPIEPSESTERLAQSEPTERSEPEPDTSEPVAGAVVATDVPDEPRAVRSTRGVRALAYLVLLSGVILIAAGAFTWFVVRDQLSDEKITVSDDADRFGGDSVDGPLTAYAEADVINEHALEDTDGLTYAQLERDDPRRDTVMTASFLRASLFTSVVSFGVAAFAAGMGIVLVLVAWALLRIDRNLRAT
jgi:hypothetical protein